jgi:hypothetical protein
VRCEHFRAGAWRGAHARARLAGADHELQPCRGSGHPGGLPERRRERGDLPFIGLIGSKSKWATFRHRLEARGFSAAELDAVTSPIGVAGVVGKEPEVIAVAVAAQLMQQRR